MQANELLMTWTRPWRLNRTPALALAAWTLAMVALPIVKWAWGDGVKYDWLVLSVALQATAVMIILMEAWGWRRTMGTAVVVMALTLLVEAVGSRTGFPFGRYYYTDLLQPQIAHVPVLIPLAWWMMLPAAWAVAARFRRSLWRFALVSALALTAWDLFLDPQMVNWGLWVWEEPGGYFGIPWSNYAGWLLTAFVLTVIIRPREIPVRPLLIIYSITWFLELFGLALFWEMPGPALVGGAVMGGFIWWGWRQAQAAEASPAYLVGSE